MAFLNFLTKRMLIVLMVLFTAITAGVLGSLFYQGMTLYHSMAIQGISLQAKVIEQVREIYSEEIVSRVKRHGMIASQDYEKLDNAIPLPANFTKKIGEELSKLWPGADIRLFSAYPFPWRKNGGPQDDFEREALVALTKDPLRPYYKFQEYRGHQVLRYAVADIMKPACVSCHNSHPQSPKRDWKVGDLRGVLETIRPLDDVGASVASTRQNILTMFVVTSGVALLGLLGLGAVLGSIQVQARALRVNEARMRGVIETSHDGIITVSDRMIRSFNPAAQSIFGRTTSEVLGQSLTSLIPLEILKKRSSRSNDVDIDEPEFLSRQNGDIFPAEISMRRMVVDREEFCVWQIRDISARYALEEQLLRARKLESVGQLAAGIAHEINTPIQFIGDNARFLRDAFTQLIPVLTDYLKLMKSDACAGAKSIVEESDLEYLREEIPKAVEQTLSGVERVARIVKAMKEFSHPGSDAMQLIDINKLISSTTIVCTNEWKYVADLEFLPGENLPLVRCFPGELSQVILNLIVNAAHAIGEATESGGKGKGRIEIRTSVVDGFIQIAISDTGRGIPDSVAPHIFDPFFTTKEVGKGTGQGLAMAHAIVTKRHGGTVHFDTVLGSGTTFYIRLLLSEGGDK